MKMWRQLSLLLLLLPCCQSMLDVWISRSESLRTLGLSAEMNYLVEGEVSSYATGFMYRLYPNVSDLRLSMRSRAPQPVQYLAKAISDEDDVIVAVRPESGLVPQHGDGELSISYRCVGFHAVRADVTVHLRFDYPSAQSQTVLRLKQEKLCAGRHVKGGSGGNRQQHDTDLFGYPRMDGYDDEDVDESQHQDWLSAEQLLYALVGGALAIVVLLFLVSLICVRSGKRRDGQTQKGMMTPTSHLLLQNQVHLDVEQPHMDGVSSSSIDLEGDGMRRASADARRTFLTSTPLTEQNTSSLERRKSAPQRMNGSCEKVLMSPPPVDIRSALVELHADRRLFDVVPSVELEGTFGEVRWAVWRTKGKTADVEGEEDGADTDAEPVLVKTLKARTATHAHFERFLQDALALHGLPAHPHLAQIAAAATFGRFESPDSVTDFPLLCYRHAGFGNLKKLLEMLREQRSPLGSTAGSSAIRNDRTASTYGGRSSSAVFLRVHDVAALAEQAADALAHLHRHGVVHGDVAARNCLVSEISTSGQRGTSRLSLQLADDALSRDLFPSDYDCVGDNENRPVRWLAPERLRSRRKRRRRTEYIESILDDVPETGCTASDVWSWGVLVWELATCGDTPWADTAADELVLKLERGVRLRQPYNCPDAIYRLLLAAWHYSMIERPTAAQMSEALTSFQTQLDHFV